MSHLAHLLLSGLQQPPVRLLVRQDKILREIKRVLARSLQAEEEIDRDVRKKIGSISRSIPEGSPEWDVLYQKYYREEEMKRQIA